MTMIQPMRSNGSGSDRQTYKISQLVRAQDIARRDVLGGAGCLVVPFMTGPETFGELERRRHPEEQSL